MKITHSEIFLLPSGNMVGADVEDFYLLYAPISQDICFMEQADAQALYNYLEHHIVPVENDLRKLADELFITNQILDIDVPKAGQTTRMSLMPNYFCNFSCSYCYSAKGRSKQVISWEKVKATLDYFINDHRVSPPQTLSLFVSGGGEPLLSWNIVSCAIDYAYERAQTQGFTLSVSLITNGSLITEEIIEWLKGRNCTVCVSFEVLEDLQNSQRGQYDTVKQSIKRLGSAGVNTMINATITPLSVGRMREMVEEVSRNYPFVKQFTMEPVTSKDLFPSSLDLRHFYDTFIEEYAKAKQYAVESGLHLRFEMDEALNSTVIRHCPGKFCLTAEGTVSACHLATSPKESRYTKCVYGKVNEEGIVMIDEAKFQQLFEENMLAKHRCDKCFARWNCGGECMARNDTYPQDYMNEVCRFNRQWLMRLLRERLENDTREEYGLTLREMALKTEIDVLREKDIYVLPADKGQWLLYAPLADSAALCGFKDIRRLGKVAMLQKETINGDTELELKDMEAMDLLDELTDVVPVADRDGYVRSIQDFTNLSILPNNVCNFSCSYCYSANGRSQQRLSIKKAISAIDFFISQARCEGKRLTVSIFGGGEPLLSWNDLVRPLMHYIHNKSQEQNRDVVVTLITNGSLLPEEFVSTCLNCKIDLVISYDILCDVQNHQRGHYDLVTENIKKMITKGVVPAINTVVTPYSVKMMEETVEQLHRLFPEIKYLSMEPVVDVQMPDKREFYGLFINHFWHAQTLAESYGIIMSCSASRKVNQTIERYCAGEMALCPDGSLSVCPCVSSPSEPHYHSYIYGNINEDGSVNIDNQRLSELLNININSHSWCNTCFARWNCAGGCMNNNNINDGLQDQDFCWFTREMTRGLILERLNQKNKE